MGEHKLAKGINAIRFLQELGFALEYSVKLEHPIANHRGTNEAVDVAWLLDPEQEFPLFILEVESKSTNGMAANPLKVFSQPSSELQKPLFFFQIVLKGGVTAGIVQTLKQQYGVFNYEVFAIDSTGWTPVINLILEQHRRMSLSINYYEVLSCIKRFTAEKDILIQAMKRLELLNFRKSRLNLLPSLASISIEEPQLISGCITVLDKLISAESKGERIADYGTYWGQEWSYPIHLGILGSHSVRALNGLFLELKNWQDKWTSMSMIGPHFGLSRDYDDFLVWNAGTLVALLASLFRDIEKSRYYFADILISVLEKTRPEWQVGNLIWLYHIIAPIDRNCTQYEYAVRGLRGCLKSKKRLMQVCVA